MHERECFHAIPSLKQLLKFCIIIFFNVSIDTSGTNNLFLESMTSDINYALKVFDGKSGSYEAVIPIKIELSLVRLE